MRAVSCNIKNGYYILSQVIKNLRGIQDFHTSPSIYTVDKLLLSKLRKKTGFPISHCKKALEAHDNDLVKSEEWLIKESQAHGWAKAVKLSGRKTSQGLIGVHINNNIGGLVEVNCETDFVARNNDFQDLVMKVAKEFTLSASSVSDTLDKPVKEYISKEELITLQTIDGKNFTDLVALAIGKVGENIQLSRGVRFTCPPGLDVVGYVHPPTSDNLGLFGRYGALVAFKNTSNQDIIRKLCAHIVGMNPSEIGSLEEVDIKSNKINFLEEADEKPINSSFMEEAEENEENEEISDKVDDKKEDEKILVKQDFLSDSEMTVGEVLRENNIEVIDFIRLECGESYKEA